MAANTCYGHWDGQEWNMDAEGPESTVVVHIDDGEREDVRTLWFLPPEDVSHEELLALGFAIDRDHAVKAVVGYADEQEQRYVPLPEALREAELEIVRHFKAKGAMVKFA